MAGGQNPGEASDNPVAINVTAIVDVIFCLCLFFLCSIHFKVLEGKIETWLPKHGNQPGLAADRLLEPIRVVLTWNHDAARTIRRVGNREASSDAELADLLLRFPKAGDPPVQIDATTEVPWKDVVRVIDIARQNGLDRLEFVEPWPPVSR
ncbi:MAG TPA: biopolymer transporter ExbD [Planctomycetota bacterium]|nr:biopolymer transporter ExbD [Planctomycetota bacterium]